MKIVLIVTLVVASSIYLVNALAGPSQNPSSTVEREASQLFSSVELRGGTQANSLLRYIQVRASMYNREFVGLKNRVGEQLSRLGNDGREIRTQLNSEAQKLVDSVREEVSTENLKPKLLAIISSWSQFAEPIQTDIAYLVSAIDASSENVKCWDENKGDLGSFINNLLSETQNIIWEELRQLNSQIEDVAASINNEVTQLEEKLQSECINNRSCYVNYVRLICFYHIDDRNLFLSS